MLPTPTNLNDIKLSKPMVLFPMLIVPVFPSKEHFHVNWGTPISWRLRRQSFGWRNSRAEKKREKPYLKHVKQETPSLPTSQKWFQTFAKID
jgi:hypothetical protein